MLIRCHLILAGTSMKYVSPWCGESPLFSYRLLSKYSQHAYLRNLDSSQSRQDPQMKFSKVFVYVVRLEEWYFGWLVVQLVSDNLTDLCDKLTLILVGIGNVRHSFHSLMKRIDENLWLKLNLIRNGLSELLILCSKQEQLDLTVFILELDLPIVGMGVIWVERKLVRGKKSSREARQEWIPSWNQNQNQYQKKSKM